MMKWMGLVFALVLIGCGEAQDENGSKATNPQGTLFSAENNKNNNSTTLDKATIYGVWESNLFNQASASVTLRMQFKSNAVTLSSQCQYSDGVTVYSQVIAAAAYSKGTTTITEDKIKIQSYEKNNKTYECEASLLKGTINTSITNGQFFTADGVTFTKLGN